MRNIVQTSSDIVLSIVMPVFNHHSDVREMIDSILANTFGDWELLTVDDGSDSETIELIERYAASDKRIRLIKRDRQPKGAQTCRNIGLCEARGEFVVFFDSDDFIMPYCLQQRVEQMKAHEELDFMVFPSGIYTDRIFHTKGYASMYGYHIYTDDVEQFSSRQLPFIVWNNIYRRDALLSHSLCWDEHLLSLQDADFNISAIAAGLRYSYAENAKPDYGYRIASTSSVSKNIKGVRHHESHVYANRKMWSVVQNAYGGKYNRALYHGTLNIYNAGLSGRGIDSRFAKALMESLKGKSCLYRLVFGIQINTTLILQKIIPSKMARQLPMAFYLTKTTKLRKRKADIIKALLAGKNQKNEK